MARTRSDAADIDALVRRAEAAGGRSLGVRPPAAAPAPPCPESTSVESGPRPAKYRNKPTVYAGIRYQSKAEADYAADLDRACLGRPGAWYVRQVVFRLGCPENTYKCDFLIFGLPPWPAVRVVDVKGFESPKFKRDLRLWRAYGPCELHVVTRSGRGWKTEIVEGGGAP